MIHLAHEYAHTHVQTKKRLLAGEARRRNKFVMNEAWEKLAPRRDTSNIHLNSAYWRLCPSDDGGERFTIQSGETWEYNDAWLNKAKTCRHSKGKGRCDYGKLFGCTAECGDQSVSVVFGSASA